MSATLTQLHEDWRNHVPPWGRPEHCRCVSMPLPPDEEAKVAELIKHETPPAKWMRVQFAEIQSRLWLEWHRARGRCPNCRPPRAPLPDWLRAAVLERDGMVCGICSEPIEDRADLHIDHIHPVARGGRSELDNLQPAHALCNIRKGARVV